MGKIAVHYTDIREGLVNEERLFSLIELGIVSITAKKNFVVLEGDSSWLEQGLYNGTEQWIPKR